jgi:hypothetical protein
MQQFCSIAWTARHPFASGTSLQEKLKLFALAAGGRKCLERFALKPLLVRLFECAIRERDLECEQLPGQNLSDSFGTSLFIHMGTNCARTSNFLDVAKRALISGCASRLGACLC